MKPNYSDVVCHLNETTLYCGRSITASTMGKAPAVIIVARLELFCD